MQLAEAVYNNPQDHYLKQVYADWLEEHDRLEEAEAWRLIAKEGWCPDDKPRNRNRSMPPGNVSWHGGTRCSGHLSANLGKALFEKTLWAMVSPAQGYPSYKEAYEHLVTIMLPYKDKPIPLYSEAQLLRQAGLEPGEYQ